ncbi:MAG: NTP transferase domain-containing protein [Bacteroidales bacterium]|nr:NTP transferase domain-containing protein [Bacteroidales bacterium]MBN2698017.1 NTP transferase domain-containing protein [Bacteroidales bacterium]
MSKRAIILAGGKGTRLRPYTVTLPKPLMPVSDYPILEVIIRQLVHYNFSHITLAVNHQADIIKAFFGDGDKWNVRIDYSLEKMPLSTMAPLRLIGDLPDNFLLMNGDILTDLDFGRFYEDHVQSNNLFTIKSYHRSHVMEYGVLKVNKNNELIGFEEKPEIGFLVSMGIYMVNKRVLQYIPERTRFGFDDLMHRLLSEGIYPKIDIHQDYWMDIGRPDDYIKAIEDFDHMKSKLLPDG